MRWLKDAEIQKQNVLRFILNLYEINYGMKKSKFNIIYFRIWNNVKNCNNNLNYLKVISVWTCINVKKYKYHNRIHTDNDLNTLFWFCNKNVLQIIVYLFQKKSKKMIFKNVFHSYQYVFVCCLLYVILIDQ